MFSIKSYTYFSGKRIILIPYHSVYSEMKLGSWKIFFLGFSSAPIILKLDFWETIIRFQAFSATEERSEYFPRSPELGYFRRDYGNEGSWAKSSTVNAPFMRETTNDNLKYAICWKKITKKWANKNRKCEHQVRWNVLIYWGNWIGNA